MPTLIEQHYRPRTGSTVREHVRSDVDPAARHLDPQIQREAATIYRAGGVTMREVARLLGLRDANAAKHAVFYGNRQLGWAQPTRSRAGRTEVLTAEGWMPHSRKFGVELEVVRVTVGSSATALERAGLAVEQNRGWAGHSVAARGHDRPTWKTMTDGSVSGGAEAVSPPMSGDSGITDLATAMRALRDAGARVDGQCGMHVHVDANDLTADQLVAMIDLWGRVQTTVFSVLPRGRRQSMWCRPNSPVDLAAYRRAAAAGTLRTASVDRYRALNVAAFRAYGTLEFRMHGGTLNHTKAKHWIALVTALVEAAARNQTSQVRDANIGELTTSLVELGLLRQDSADWLVRRAAAVR